MNFTVQIGRLTRDPELKYTSSGSAVTNFSIAVDRDYKRDGQPDVDFFNVVCWNKLAEMVAEYMSKGRLVAVQGRLENRSWDSNGQKRTVAEIIASSVQFLDKKDTTQDDSYSSKKARYQKPIIDEQAADDDLPFDC